MFLARAAAELAIALAIATATFSHWAPHVQANEWLNHDDQQNFIHNHALAQGGFGAIKDSFRLQPLQAARVASLGMYEPVSMAIKIRLRDQYIAAWPPPTPRVFLRAGVICHACSAALIYTFSMMLLRRAGGDADAVGHAAAAAGAIAWATSTARAEILGWASCLSYCFAAVLVALALLLLVAQLPRRRVASSASSWVPGSLAMFCKSAAAPLGVVVAVMCLACDSVASPDAVVEAGNAKPGKGFRPKGKGGAHGRGNGGVDGRSAGTAALASRVLRHALVGVPLLATAALATICQLTAMPQKPEAGQAYSPAERVARALEVVWIHTAVWPGGTRRVIYLVPFQGFLASMGAIAGGALVAAVSIAAAAALLTPPPKSPERQPFGAADAPLRLAAACWLSYLALLLPGALIQSPHTQPGMGHDRYFYVASLCLCPLPALGSAALAALAADGTRDARVKAGPNGRGQSTHAVRAVLVLGSFGAVALQMRATPAAAAVWQSTRALWSHSHRQLVTDAQPWLAFRRGRWEAAERGQGREPLRCLRHGPDRRKSCPSDALRGECARDLVRMHRECPGSCGVANAVEYDHVNTLAQYLHNVYTTFASNTAGTAAGGAPPLASKARDVSNLVVDVWPRNGEHMFRRGEDAFLRGDYAAAVATFDWVLNVWPNHHNVWGMRWAMAWGYAGTASLHLLAAKRTDGGGNAELGERAHTDQDAAKAERAVVSRVKEALTRLRAIMAAAGLPPHAGNPLAEQLQAALKLLRELGYESVAVEIERS